MKSPIAGLALFTALSASLASAQNPAGGPASRGGLPGRTSSLDPSVQPASTSSEVRTPAAFEELKPPTIALPQDAIEPYLLTRQAGPFMVMAKSFRGGEAERYALALVLELRREYGLPAYILRSKDFPGSRSNIRNVPPTAPPGVDRARLSDPERVRSYDEAVVLVGDEKTLKGSEELLHRVKKIKPKCLDGMPSLFHWRQGLSHALRTTNPYVPAQDLFPGKPDPIIAQMNEGPRSILHCPGRYTLQVVDFSGRSTFNISGAQSLGDTGLKRSPLYTAAADAEKLANALAKAEEIRRLGQPVYVYHDRTSSRVTIGSFDSPNDPRALQLRESLVRMATQIMDTKDLKTNRPVRNRGIDVMIAPATFLTDLEPIKKK